jgi:hypothetical protein
VNAIYAVFFAAFTFAHLALCAAAIFFRAAAESVRLPRIVTTFACAPLFSRTLAQRALWAAAIRARAAAESLPLLQVRFRIPCQKLQARHQLREVLFSTDLVPSLTAARLQSDCPLSSPSREIVSKRCARPRGRLFASKRLSGLAREFRHISNGSTSICGCRVNVLPIGNV